METEVFKMKIKTCTAKWSIWGKIITSLWPEKCHLQWEKICSIIITSITNNMNTRMPMKHISLMLLVMIIMKCNRSTSGKYSKMSKTKTNNTFKTSENLILCTITTMQLNLLNQIISLILARTKKRRNKMRANKTTWIWISNNLTRKPEMLNLEN